ncbi:hypothetical protein WH5701_16695 [Synechococcus sp. WH 5701]|nr:hypothetical protein WH5701_16695 [Synechococcus sp. WH 5701]
MPSKNFIDQTSPRQRRFAILMRSPKNIDDCLAAITDDFYFFR